VNAGRGKRIHPDKIDCDRAHRAVCALGDRIGLSTGPTRAGYGVRHAPRRAREESRHPGGAHRTHACYRPETRRAALTGGLDADRRGGEPLGLAGERVRPSSAREASVACRFDFRPGAKRWREMRQRLFKAEPRSGSRAGALSRRDHGELGVPVRAAVGLAAARAAARAGRRQKWVRRLSGGDTVDAFVIARLSLRRGWACRCDLAP